MDIFSFADRYRLSLRKARQMAADGVLVLDLVEDEELQTIRHYLGRGQGLTALHLCRLTVAPEALKSLGKYQAKARDQVEALGLVEPAPRSVAACISDASRGDPEAVEVLSGWIARTLPHYPVSHAWIAVRLLMGLSPAVRSAEARRLPRAMFNVRKAIDAGSCALGYRREAGMPTSYFLA